MSHYLVPLIVHCCITLHYLTLPKCQNYCSTTLSLPSITILLCSIVVVCFVASNGLCVILFYFSLERFSPIVLKTSEGYKLSYLPWGLQRRIKDIVCTPKPVHTKTTYKGVAKLDTVHYYDVLIFKNGSTEVDSSIEALDLTLQRGATSS